MIHQLYENESDDPLEITFVMPLSDAFFLDKIEIDFVLSDGSVKSIVSKIETREKAEQDFQDFAQGKTAVELSDLAKTKAKFPKNTIRITLGNMPPNSKAFLRAYCNQ